MSAEIVEILRHLDPEYSMSIDLLGGIRVRPCPAVRLALLFVLDETFADGFLDIAHYFDNPAFHAMLTDPAGLRPIATQLVEACLRDEPKALAKLSRIDDRHFVLLVQASMAASYCRDVSMLFERRRQRVVANMPGMEPDTSDIAVDVRKTAEKLKAGGYDAETMSWTRLRFAEAMEAERSRESLVNNAVASRLGQAAQKGWDNAMRELNQ